MNQDALRLQLINLLDFGMKLGAIAKNINISTIDLSRFKNGHIYLTRENAEKLERFLGEINIPESI